MLPQVTDEQLGEAVLQSAKDGLYPDSEEVISANIPATALPVLLQYLNDAREEVKSDIRERSRGTAPDIDGWISQAKQLQADIEESRASARQIVRQSEAEKSLEGQVNDASSKVDLLKGEVFFNETLAETLEQIERIHQLLYSVQEATLGDRLLDAIVWLEKAQEEIGMLRTFENTRVVKILRGKATDIHGAIVETIDDCWKALLRMDTSTGRVTIKHEIQRATLVDVHAIVMALTKLGLLKTKINELYHGFDKVILAPRMVLGPDNNVAAISVIGDDIQVTGRLPDTDVKHLFEDIETMIDYLSTRLPPSIAVPLSELLMPGLVSQLISKWLLPSVPSSLDGMQDFQEMLALVLQLADVVDSVGWRGKEDLHDWVEQAPRVWLTKRRETSLDTVRALLSKGVGNSRMVERVETQTVSPEDKMFQGPGGGGEGDDWNAGWSEDEDKSNVTSTSTQGEKEGDFSAWDLEKTTDDGEIESKTTNAQDNANDDLDEGWGWGDDDEDQESSAPPSRTKTKKSTSTNKRHVQGPPDSSKREVTLKEKYSITALPAAVLEIIEQVVSDAEILAQPNYMRSPIAPAAAGLFLIPTLILAMYRATAPAYYASNMSGSMFLYNDSMWLAEQLQVFADNQALRAGAKSPRAIGKLKLGPDIDSLEVFAKRTYGREMNSQRTILGDLLDGAQGFANCTEPPFAGECETAISSTVDRIRIIHGQWKGVLSHSALLQSLGSLLSTVTSKIIMDIEDMTDISEPESQRLAAFCNAVSNLEDLFVPEQPPETSQHATSGVPLTAVYTPNWLKFQYLSNILESSLVDIKYLWSEGELSLEFTADEVVDLIEALFADSEHRRKAIGEIRRSSIAR